MLHLESLTMSGAGNMRKTPHISGARTESEEHFQQAKVHLLLPIAYHLLRPVIIYPFWPPGTFPDTRIARWVVRGAARE
jgi:hypothetical protein